MHFGHFEPYSTFWGHMVNVYYSFYAHWRGRSWLPVRVNRIVSLAVTAEALRAKTDWQSAFWKGVDHQHPPNFHCGGRPPPIIFARTNRPMNALQLCRWQFSHKETL